MSDIPIGVPMSKIRGQQMELLKPEEKLKLLDMRHQDFQNTILGHDGRFLKGQWDMDRMIPMIEVLNGILRDEFRVPAFWMPNRPWRESEEPLNHADLTAAMEICSTMAIRWEAESSIRAAKARDALKAMLE